jgi:predicted phosphodiesterase
LRRQGWSTTIDESELAGIDKQKRENMSTRRTFLAGMAGATVLTQRILSAAEELNEFSFAVISDTHLGRQDSQTPERQWRKAIDEINAAPCDFVLHLGDIVDGGRESQYPVYAETRKLLRKPIHEIPGNHDPLPLFEQHVRPKVDTSFDHAGVRFVLLANAHTDSHDGFITSEQIAWLDKRYRDAAERDLKIVVCCHVPVHTNRHPDRGWFVKPADGQTAFYELVDRHTDRLLACFHGHFHNSIRGWQDRRSLVEVLFPSLCYNQQRHLAAHIAAGRAGGFYVDELRPGYVLATLGRGRLTLRYKPLEADFSGEHVAKLGDI